MVIDANMAPDFSSNVWKNLFDPTAISSGRMIKYYIIAFNSHQDFAACQDQLDIFYKHVSSFIVPISNAVPVNCKMLNEVLAEA